MDILECGKRNEEGRRYRSQMGLDMCKLYQYCHVIQDPNSVLQIPYINSLSSSM